LAARGSPLGIGSDLGGSIRIPAHYCGVHGFKPTLGLLPRSGARGNFLGLEAIQAQVGPLARHVDDLALAMEVLSGPEQPIGARGGLPVPFSRSCLRDVRGMRIGYWTDDGGLPVSPAITRAVEEAAAALRSAGAIVEKIAFTRGDEVLELFVSLVQADGGANLRRIAAGSPLDWRVSRILTLAGLWRPLRMALAAGLKLSGQKRLARIAAAGRSRSADAYWRLVTARDALECQLLERMQTERYDALLTPAHGLPAPQHGKPIDLLSAASTTLLPNVLGWPAGVVSLSRVRADEESNRPASRDKVEQQAQAVERGSAGLPVGVQVISSRFRDADVLAVMKALEQAFKEQADYPGNADLPITAGAAQGRAQVASGDSACDDRGPAC
jgi:fatty acid amide hydrolase